MEGCAKEESGDAEFGMPRQIMRKKPSNLYTDSPSVTTVHLVTNSTEKSDL